MIYSDTLFLRIKILGGMRKTCSRTARVTGSLQDCLDSTTLKNMKSNTLFELTKIRWSTQKHILAFNLAFFKSGWQNHLN